MKKTLLFGFLWVSIVGWSQVTYNSTDFAAINNSYIVSHATNLIGLDFTAAGPNTAWDYSALIPDTQETQLWENPNNTGYKTSWCFSNNYLFTCNSQFAANFNLAVKQLDGLQIQGYGLSNAYMHSKLSTANFANKMIGANVTVTGVTLPFTVSYTQPDILYQFPMHYNDTYTNPVILAFDLNSLAVPLSYSSVGQRANIVEGWGALTTPFGTFPSVLKIKSTLTESITTVINGQSTVTDQETVSYKWLDPAYGIPVLEVSGQVVNGLWTPTATTYFDIRRCLTPTALFTNFPLASDYDPTSQSASVSFINLGTNYDNSDWDFGDGTPHSTVKNPTHNYTCPGLKQVTLTVTNVFCDPDQTATITLPVTITDTQNAFTTGVTVNATGLTADRTLSGTTYQWLDCDNANAPISGQTAQTYTPATSGNYAVALTTNGCTDVSDCYVFAPLAVTDFDDNHKPVLWPNPTKGKLELKNNTLLIQKINVFNAIGMLVGTSLDLTEMTSGIYLVKITTDKGIYTQKVIKE